MGKFCFNITSWRSRNDVVCQGPDRVGVVVPRWLKSGLYVRLCAASKISKNINDINDFGGRGGIRTHGTLAGTPVFKTGALNHSATLPFQRQQALSKREIKNDLRTGPRVLQATALPAGGAVPNYDYGYGIIRPVAAGRSLGIIP